MTSSIRCAHGVRTKVGRLRRHVLLKSDWFSVINDVIDKVCARCVHKGQASAKTCVLLKSDWFSVILTIKREY